MESVKDTIIAPPNAGILHSTVTCPSLLPNTEWTGVMKLFVDDIITIYFYRSSQPELINTALIWKKMRVMGRISV